MRYPPGCPYEDERSPFLTRKDADMVKVSYIKRGYKAAVRVGEWGISGRKVYRVFYGYWGESRDGVKGKL